MLCYIASGVTPDIAYDRDEYAKPLAEKLRTALGERGGSQPVEIHFGEEEAELRRQFEGCAYHIAEIWEEMKGGFSA